MKNKTAKIVIICVVSSLAVCMIFGVIVYFAFFRDVVSDDIEIYNKAQSMSKGLMPEVSEFEPCNNLKFTYHKDKFAFFVADTYTLTANYDKSEYARKKEYFISRNELKSRYNDGEYYVVTLDNDYLGIDSRAEYSYAFNDNTNQIRFEYMYDFD